MGRLRAVAGTLLYPDACFAVVSLIVAELQLLGRIMFNLCRFRELSGTWASIPHPGIQFRRNLPSPTGRMIGIAEKHLTHVCEKQKRNLLPRGRIGFCFSSLCQRGIGKNILRMCVRLEFGFSSPEGDPVGKLLPEARPVPVQKHLTCVESKMESPPPLPKSFLL